MARDVRALSFVIVVISFGSQLAILIENIANWQTSIEDVFSQAIANKELTGERSAAKLSRFFVMGIYGLRTYAQTHPQADVMHELAEQLFSGLCQE